MTTNFALEPGPNPFEPLETISSYAHQEEVIGRARLYVVDTGADMQHEVGSSRDLYGEALLTILDVHDTAFASRMALARYDAEPSFVSIHSGVWSNE